MSGHSKWHNIQKTGTYNDYIVFSHHTVFI